MPAELGQDTTPDRRLSEIVAAYRSARAAVQAPDPDELFGRYPDLADRLRPILAGLEAGGRDNGAAGHDAGDRRAAAGRPFRADP